MNQPETFAQLLAKATPGPFGVSESGKSIWHGDPEEYLSVCHTSFETTEHTPADMELIARLLNFAHSGGIKSYLSMNAHLTSSVGESSEATRLIAILNGQTLNNPSK